MQQVFHMLDSGVIDDDLKGILKSANIAQGSLRSHQLSELPLLEPLSLSNITSDVCKLVPAVRRVICQDITTS